MARKEVRAILLSLLVALASVGVQAAPPIFLDPGVITTDEDVQVVLPLASLFADIDGDIQSYSTGPIAHPDVASTAINGPNLEINLTLDASGNIGVVQVRAHDGPIGDGTNHTTTGSIALFVTPVNDAPRVVNPPGLVSTNEDFDTDLEMGAVFADPEGDPITLSVFGFSHPAIQTASFAGTQLDIAVVPNASGSGSVRVIASDGNGGNTPLDVTVDVIPQNDPPVVDTPPGLIVTAEDNDPVVDMSSAFSDVDGDPLTLTVTGIAHGAVFAAAMNGSNLEVTLVADASGSGTITVTADDGNGGTESQDVTLDVTPENDAPVVAVAPAIVDTDEDNDVVTDLSATFSDVDGDVLVLGVTGWTNPAIQNAVMNGTNLEITVVADAFGSGDVTVQADDGNGGFESVDVTVNVNAVNDAPQIDTAPAPIVTDEDVDTNADLSAVFSDADGDALTLSVSGWTNPAIQNASMAGSTLNITLVNHAFGVGDVTVEADDGNGGVTPVVISVTVNTVNDEPEVAAAPGAVDTDEDFDTVVDMSAAFSDADGDALVLSVTGWANAAIQNAVMNGTNLEITVVPDAFGSGDVTVLADDGNGGTETLDVTINVNEVNDAPTVVGAVFDVNVAEDAANETRNLAGVFADVDDPVPGDPLSLSLGGNTNAGLFADVDLTGTLLSLDFAANANGTAVITVVATDRDGETASYDVNVTVAAENDDPFVANPPADIVTDEEIDPSLSLVGVFDDVDIPEGDTLTLSVTAFAHPAIASANMLGDTLAIDLNTHGFGVGTVTVQAEDLAGATVSVDVNVTVNELNDPPVQVGVVPLVSVFEDAPASNIDLSGIFTDPDHPSPGDPLTLAVTAISDPGLFDSANVAGTTLVLDYAANQNGPADVTVTATDRGGLTAFYIVSVDVAAVNDAPFVASPAPDLNTVEDVNSSVSLAGVFDDVDIATNGDALGYAVTAVAHPAIDVASMAGEVLSVDLLLHAFGTGTVTVTATDSGGESVDVDVTVNVTEQNDLPFVIANPPAENWPEDTPPFIVDLAGVFGDADINDGETLSISLAELPGYDPIFDAYSVSGPYPGAGEDLLITLAANQHGQGRLEVTATDADGGSAVATLIVNIGPVNDAPFVSGVISDINMNEDDPTLNVVTDGFDDVDIATTGDVIDVIIDNNTAPGLFSNLTFTGESLSITLIPDANGTADVTVHAEDQAGAASAPITFRIIVDGTNDIPDVENDTLADAGITDPWLEDQGEIRFPVLDNDYLGDVPATIVSITQPALFYFVDGAGDSRSEPSGEAYLDGDEIVFVPADNFWGDVEFTYNVQDNNGDVDPEPATVSFTIQPVNDAPEAVTYNYSVEEDQVLVVSDVTGLLSAIYDIDPNRVDENGDPLEVQTLSVVYTSSPPAGQGRLEDALPDGSFRFIPAPGWDGTTFFTYAIYDGIDLSDNATVRIEVDPKPDPVDPPNPGEVDVLFDLANTPLEQTTSVLPNVLVTMDDSGSMDWNFAMDMADEQGRFPITNATIANNSQRYRTYSYLWNLPTNTYRDWSSCCGRILPTEAGLDANGFAGNDYGVWRGRSPAFNSIYYNPEVQYEPWVGVDPDNVVFADADPEAIRLDPTSNVFLFDITAPHTYRSTSVPRWNNGGGSTTFNQTTYIPRYYQADGTEIVIAAGNGPFPGGEERTDCLDEDNCTYDEEIQNFANWFQYYRSRGHVAKAATGFVVAGTQNLRIGYETINGNVNEPIAEMNEYYWEGEKEELLDAIYSVPNRGGTPLRRALADSGRILSCTHTGRGCPALPADEGMCQQNFSLLFSDGYWNGSSTLGGNHDGDSSSEWDGGKYNDNRAATLADVAMFYYENDMFPAVADKVPVGSSDIAGAPDGTFPAERIEMHQHMKTYTIAFGVEGTLDVDDAYAEDPAGTINWPSPFTQSTGKIDDLLHAALNGRGRFLSAGDPGELRNALEAAFLEFTQATSSSSAAAFNSTSLREDTLFYRAFYDLRHRTGELTATPINEVTGELEPPVAWAAAERLDPTHAEGLTPAQRTIVTFNPDGRDGVPFQFSRLAPSQTDVLDSDQVYWLRGERDDEMPNGTLRERQQFQGILGDIVNSSPVYVAEPLALDRDQEPYPIGDLYSEFKTLNKDRQEMIYVGANDGMLHGFDALTGVEQFAYVPNMVIDSNQTFNNKLDYFTSNFYLHNYYVDLTPRFNDIYMNGDWHTVLVGGLGAGGKGFYALDVTDPDTAFVNETAASAAVLWEFTEADDTYPRDVNGNFIGGAENAILDGAGNPVKDMGYSLSLPIVTMSNDETGGEQDWVAIFGNGPNSTSGIATLFVLYMDRGIGGWGGANDFTKISTGYGVPLPGEELAGYPNGLGTPTAVDLDRNGTVDFVYAGDRMGHLFRFDMRSDNPANWKAVLLFEAVYNDGGGDRLQPILAKPVVIKHPSDVGFLVTFGTGSFITEDDAGNTDIQSIYTIWDNLSDNPDTAEVGSKYSRLVEQEITNFVIREEGDYNTYRRHSSNPVEYERDSGGTPGTYGWYIDLDMERADQTTDGDPNPSTAGNAPPAVQFPGEKAIRRWLVRGSPRDGMPILVTTTVLPANDQTACFGVRPGSLLVFDAMTGSDPGVPVLDFDNDRDYDDDDLKEDGDEEYSAGILFDQDDFDGALVDPSTLSGQGGNDWLYISGGTETRVMGIASAWQEKTDRLSWTQLVE